MRKTFILISILMCGVSVLCWMLYPDRANSGPYLDSAHGNTNDGVKRSATGFPTDYTRGLCAHCHEQHASIGGTEPAPNSPAGPDFYLLFKDLWETPIQSNVFCFGCHVEISSYQSGGQILNYSYSNHRGGGTDSCPDSIYKSFQFVLNNGASQSNCGSTVGSSHMLQDIRAFLRNKWGFSGTASQVDPCSGCHNPHKAKKEFPCSLPSAHTDIYAWDVWGDNSSEKMNAYTLNYWAPKRVGGGYEPDGSATQDGSNLADYITFCTDCHNATTTINSTRLGRNLYKINWGPGGDFHGDRARIDNGGDFSEVGEYGDLIEPYKVSGSYSRINYVLSCTDCHEPHGSKNEFLLRRTVNGTELSDNITPGLWFNWCQLCHSINLPFSPNQHLPPVSESTNCFQGGACHSHCEGAACSSNNLF